MTELTPEQEKKLDRAVMRAMYAAILIAGLAWLMFVGAIWFGQWRMAGVGVMISLLSVACFAVAAGMRSSAAREGAARKAADKGKFRA